MTAPPEWDFSDLRAVYINCTLTPSPGRSHTQTLMDRSITVMERNGVTVTSIRAVDHDIAPGVWPDMTEHGWDTDEWPSRARSCPARPRARCRGRPRGSR